MERSTAGTKGKRSPDGLNYPNEYTIIIIYHDWRGSHVKSDNTHTHTHKIKTHPLAHILDSDP